MTGTFAGHRRESEPSWKGRPCSLCRVRPARVEWVDLGRYRTGRCKQCASGELLGHATGRAMQIPRLALAYAWARVLNR